MTFGEKIKEARGNLNMSQDDLAAAMELSRRSITAWETDKSRPRTRKIYEKLSEVLNVPLNYLLTEDEAFVVESGEKFGYRGSKGAEELMHEVTGLFSGGKMQEEDMDAFMFAVQQAYLDAKMKNKKYTPKKYLNNDKSDNAE